MKRSAALIILGASLSACTLSPVQDIPFDGRTAGAPDGTGGAGVPVDAGTGGLTGEEARDDGTGGDSGVGGTLTASGGADSAGGGSSAMGGMGGAHP